MVNRYKFSWLQVITGKPGTGKSWSALTESEIVDKDFSIDDVGFTPKQYLEVLHNAKTGNFVVWDECGLGLSARKWQSASNILITEVLQTFRHKRIGVIMVVPDLSFIDVQARKLVFSFWAARRYGYNPPYCRTYEISPDEKSGKLYFPHPKLQIQGRTIKLSRLTMKRKPSEELIEEYEPKHTKFKRRIEAKASRQVAALERELGSTLTVFDYADKIEQDPIKYTNTAGNIDWRLVKAHLKLSREKSQSVATIYKTGQHKKSAPTPHMRDAQ